MSVLVFADTFEGKVTKSSLEAINYASKIGTATVITYGNVEDAELTALGNVGASKVLVNRDVDAVEPEKLCRLVMAAVESESSDIIVFSQDYTGKTIAPIVSAKLKAGLVSGAVALPNTENGFTVKKTVFSGKAFATVSVKTAKKVIAIVPNSVGVEGVEGTAEVATFAADLGTSTIAIKGVKKEGVDGQIPLTEADYVVSAGRGLKGPENWGMVEELATELGAATACSRPVADIGWRPHHEHVGQTGIAIRPNLYIAIGISGAIQHLAGVNGSKVIVVINTDDEAPFFKAADYGIVGDAFDVVPKLVEAIKKFKAAS